MEQRGIFSTNRNIRAVEQVETSANNEYPGNEAVRTPDAKGTSGQWDGATPQWQYECLRERLVSIDFMPKK